jgi:hypothetical protein
LKNLLFSDFVSQGFFVILLASISPIAFMQQMIDAAISARTHIFHEILTFMLHRHPFLPEDYYDVDTKGLGLIARSEGKFVYRQLVPAE